MQDNNILSYSVYYFTFTLYSPMLFIPLSINIVPIPYDFLHWYDKICLSWKQTDQSCSVSRKCLACIFNNVCVDFIYDFIGCRTLGLERALRERERRLGVASSWRSIRITAGGYRHDAPGTLCPAAPGNRKHGPISAGGSIITLITQ